MTCVFYDTFFTRSSTIPEHATWTQEKTQINDSCRPLGGQYLREGMTCFQSLYPAQEGSMTTSSLPNLGRVLPMTDHTCDKKGVYYCS